MFGHLVPSRGVPEVYNLRRGNLMEKSQYWGGGESGGFWPSPTSCLLSASCIEDDKGELVSCSSTMMLC